MKSTSLRIGNLVLSKINGLSTIEQLGSSLNKNYIAGRSLDGDYWENSYIPIELTEDWLFNFGFERFDAGGFSLNNSIYTVELIRNHWHLLYRSEHTIAQPFRYVHELQNLFYALTGTELELI